MNEPIAGVLPPGMVFHGRYEIVRCIKAGGMGTVYECLHLKTRKRHALKVMLPQIVANPAMRARFELEARVTAEIESDHIVATFDAGIDDASGAPFLVMELLRGEELQSILEKRGPRTAEETVVLLSQAARALDKTHAAGIVHRDLKPENLFVTIRDDGSPSLKILDFGIAKVLADNAHPAQQTATIGTPLFMSPEQIRGDGAIGPRSDLYALAHIAYALLVGAAYWTLEQEATPAIFGFLAKVLAGAPEPPTARAWRRGVVLPAAFDAWFARATAIRASDRFEGASMQIAQLAMALGVAAPRSSFHSAPLGAVSGAVAQVSPSGRAPGAAGAAVAPGNRTTGLVSTAHTIAPRSPSRTPLVALGLIAVTGVGAGAVALYRPHAAVVAAPATAVVVNAASPSGVEPAPPPVVAPAEPLPAAPTAHLAEPPVPPPPVSASPPKGAMPSPKAGVKSSGASSAKPPAPAAPDCNPPFEVDAAGRRHIKPQCL